MILFFLRVFDIDVNSRLSSVDFHHQFLCTLKPQVTTFFSLSSFRFFLYRLYFFKNVLFFFFFTVCFVCCILQILIHTYIPSSISSKESENIHVRQEEERLEILFFLSLCLCFSFCVYRKKERNKENFDSSILTYIWNQSVYDSFYFIFM